MLSGNQTSWIINLKPLVNMTLCLVNYGLQSPTGTDAAMSIANVLGGISRISHLKTIVDKKLRPVPLGIAEYLTPKMSNTERIKSLLLPAIEEAIQPLIMLAGAPKRVRLILGLPADRPGLEKALASKLDQQLEAFSDRFPLKLAVEYVRRDHGAGLAALQKAQNLCVEDKENVVLVGGVDSFVSKDTIAWLERANQLYCSGNKAGYTPGEAAACCLVCHESKALKDNLPIKAKIIRTASAREPSKHDNTLVNAGKGLSEAMLGVLEALPDRESVQEVLSTLKGNRQEANEFAFSILSVGRYLEKPGEYVSLCHRWGDIGAASAPALIIYAAEKRALEFSEAGYQLVFAISPDSFRSAALVQTV